jgi:hypothetical protein
MSNTGHRSKAPNWRVSRWAWIEDVLFSRSAACVATCLAALIVLGCMSISLGGHSVEEVKVTPETSAVLLQEGRIPVRPGGEQDVYYPVAYSSRPNVEIDDPLGLCDIVDQKENCFRVRFHANSGNGAQVLTWKARGAHVPQPAVAQPAPATETVQPAASASPAPVPVSAPSPQP